MISHKTMKSIFVFVLLCLSNHIIAQNDFELLVSKTLAGSNDLSNEKKIAILEPSKAYVNIYGIDKMPTTKKSNLHAWMEVYDGNGNYFKKKVILNAQGNSSLSLEKKNIAVDFCEDDWIGDKTTEITIGNWVPQDAFHFKAFYTDYFRGLGITGYKLYDLITEDRLPIAVRAGIDGVQGAKYHPDAFPCIVFLNGDFYGIFAWQLKKHRKNMSMDKAVAENIHIDGTINDQTLFRGDISWKSFEIKNPKTLYCVDTEVLTGYVYLEITNDAAELDLMGDNYIVADINPKDMDSNGINEESPLYLQYTTSKGKIKYYKKNLQQGLAYKQYNGDAPQELIDSDMPYYDPNNMGHVNTDKVKRCLVTLSSYWAELNNLVEEGATDDVIKLEYEKRFDINSMIDYYLHLMITMNGDGVYKNWQWFTYDGVKWFVTPYDMDQTHGMTLYGGTLRPGSFASGMTSSGPMYWVHNYYQEEVKERYNYLRNNNMLSTGSWLSIANSWYSKIGQTYYDREINKWPNSPCYKETICSNNWTTDESLWKYYGKVADYSDAVIYNEGDMCKAMARVWKATGTSQGVKPYIINGYVENPDNIERVETWISTHLDLLDKRFMTNNTGTSETYSLNISAAGVSTVCLPFDFTITDGMRLFTVEGTNDDILVLTETNSAEAYRPYLIFGTPGQYVLTGTSIEPELESPEYLVNGLLIGTLENAFAPKDSYVLQNKNSKVGFYYVAEDGKMMIAKNRAYMSTSSISLNTKANNYKLNDEASSLISSFAFNANKPVQIYNINGIKQSNLSKGINIVVDDNGKSHKLMVK